MAHLTFREAQALSNTVAVRLGDDRFRISLGALSNYETIDALPGSVHALYSLAAIYAIDFSSLLLTGGLRVEGNDPRTPASTTTGWMDEVLASVGEIPCFLWPWLAQTLGDGWLDPRAIYLWGSGQQPLDPRLEGALAAVVDRGDRRLSAREGSRPSLFMLRLENDAHICCSAALDRGRVIVHPAPTLDLGPRWLPREHVEIIGRVTAVLRKLRT